MFSTLREFSKPYRGIAVTGRFGAMVRALIIIETNFIDTILYYRQKFTRSEDFVHRGSDLVLSSKIHQYLIRSMSSNKVSTRGSHKSFVVRLSA